MTDTIEARVARGAAWLDEHEPGWERRIDLAALDLADSCRCVLGQLWGDYGDWLNHRDLAGELGRWLADGSYPYWPTEHGFSERLVTGRLDEAWIALIKERFASGLLSDEVSS